jgi:hypothetical protein
MKSAHQGKIAACEFNSKGSFLATASEKGTWRLNLT